MTARKPFRDWLMGSLGNSEMSSFRPTWPMHNYPDPIRQLDNELAVLSRTTRGRALHARLREAGISVAGAESALEVARGLEWNPRVQPDPIPTSRTSSPARRETRKRRWCSWSLFGELSARSHFRSAE